MVLGTEFWSGMGIVPDVRRGEWYFSEQVTEGGQLNSVQTNMEDIITSELTPSLATELNSVVDKYFNLMGDILGCTNVVTHKIVTSSVPIKQRCYPVSPHVQKCIDAGLQKMLDLDVVEKSNSGWSSPVIMVPKKDGTYRFCVDYRKLNTVTEKDAYPLPYISDMLDNLRGAKFLSSLDIKSACWQVLLEENSRQYTAFTIPSRGLFQFNHWIT